MNKEQLEQLEHLQVLLSKRVERIVSVLFKHGLAHPPKLYDFDNIDIEDDTVWANGCDVCNEDFTTSFPKRLLVGNDTRKAKAYAEEKIKEEEERRKELDEKRKADGADYRRKMYEKLKKELKDERQRRSIY